INGAAPNLPHLSKTSSAWRSIVTARCRRGLLALVCALLALCLGRGSAGGAEVALDLTAYRRECGVGIEVEGGRIRATWPIVHGGTARLSIDARPGHVLIDRLRIETARGSETKDLLSGVDPVYFVTVGTRTQPRGDPPGMSVFNVFFDAPASRPHQTYKA